MDDTLHTPMSEVMREAINRFLQFAQHAMLGIMNGNCVVTYSHEDDICHCRFIVDNPLTNTAFLMVQLTQGVDDALEALEYEFSYRKYKKVYGEVTTRNTDMLRNIPYESIRDSLFDYMLDLAETEVKPKFRSFGIMDLDRLQTYSHLNDVNDGCLKMLRRYPAEAGFKSFNITVQLIMQPVGEIINRELIEEARVAVAN